MKGSIPAVLRQGAAAPDGGAFAVLRQGALAGFGRNALKALAAAACIAVGLAAGAAVGIAAGAASGAGIEAYAAPDGAITLKEVQEAKEVRIVIDGELGAYNDTALRIHDRILLPFREILTKLGVPDDDGHILWNGSEQSVTVNAGGSVIKLRIGDSDILLDGEPITFDVAPYVYPVNNRTYVPVRAVAELMDKLVEWEGSTSTVFVRDKANYEKTVNVLTAQRNANGRIKRYRLESSGAVDMRLSSADIAIPGASGSDGLSIVTDTGVVSETDTENGVYHVTQNMSVLGAAFVTETYIVKDRMFVKSSGAGSKTGAWTDVTAEMGTDAYAAMNGALSAGNALNDGDIGSQALGVAVGSRAGGGFAISGELSNVAEVGVLVNSILRSMALISDDSGMDMKINSYQMRSELDPNYFPISAYARTDADMSISQSFDDGRKAVADVHLDYAMDIAYKDVNADFTIELPAEIAAMLK